MKKVRAISPGNQKKVDWAKKKGIILDDLILAYGLMFILKLLKSLEKPQATGPNTTWIIYPRTKVAPDKRFDYLEQYVNALEEAGFKLKRYEEDFIDEDTGEIVTIERKKIYYVSRKKSSKK
jgi:hypothetical protein